MLSRKANHSNKKPGSLAAHKASTTKTKDFTGLCLEHPGLPLNKKNDSKKKTVLHDRNCKDKKSLRHVLQTEKKGSTVRKDNEDKPARKCQENQEQRFKNPPRNLLLKTKSKILNFSITPKTMQPKSRENKDRPNQPHLPARQEYGSLEPQRKHHKKVSQSESSSLANLGTRSFVYDKGSLTFNDGDYLCEVIA